MKTLAILVLTFFLPIFADCQCPLTNGGGCDDWSNYSTLGEISNFPIKTIRIDFHVIQDQNANNNIPSTQEALFIDIVSKMNNIFSNLEHPAILNPQPPTYYSTQIPDCRVRFVVSGGTNNNGVYFHQSADYWDGHNLNLSGFLADSYNYCLSTLQPFQKDSVMHYIIYGSTGLLLGGLSGCSGGDVQIKGMYDTYLAHINDLNLVADICARYFLHEFGHHCMLKEPYFDLQNGNPCEIKDAGSSNNIMDDWPSTKSALTPCQIGLMHWVLSKKYYSECCPIDVDGFIVKGCQYEPQSSITLNDGLNHTWFSEQRMTGDLIITSNSTLTLKCKLKMPPNSKIIIDPHAKLIVDGGTITSSCTDAWEGIEVRGNNAANQYLNPYGYYNQGYLELRDAVIENAHVAVALWNPDVWNTFGGIVKCYNTIFKNNWKSVGFMTYHNYYTGSGLPAPNQSSFDHCTFSITRDFRRSSFDTQISMWDIEGINFVKCDFIDSRPNTFSTDMGKGIYSLDASYSIKSFCRVSTQWPNPCPEVDLERPHFSGFLVGIEALSTHGSKVITVDHSDFDHNVKGILLSIMDQSSITHCNFVLGNCLANDKPAEFGLEINQSTGYRIEENNFQGLKTAKETNGLYIYNSGSEYNEVYKNQFHDLNFAEQAIAKNRNENNIDGLQFLCNVHTNTIPTGMDIIAAKDPNLSDWQIHGIRINQGEPDFPAGNEFTQEQTNINQSDITNDNNNPFFYYYNAINKQQPFDYTQFKVSPYPIEIENTCPSKVSKIDPIHEMSLIQRDSVKNVFNQSEQAYYNLLYNYKQLIDGGNTNQVLNQIEFTWPENAWALRTDLLARSPYLSVEVLKSVANKNVLPIAMLLEVCLSNPDATRSESFIEFIRDEIPTPMPEYMLNLIRANRDLRTLRTHLESLLASYSEKATFLSNVLLTDMKKDSTNNNVDSIIYYTFKRQSLESYYSMIELFISNGDYTRASDSLSQISNRFHFDAYNNEIYNEYLVWFYFRQNLHLNNRTFMQLDSTEVSYLTNLAMTYTGLPGLAIRNLLCFGYKICIESEVIQQCNSQRIGIEQPKRTDFSANIRIFPNPGDSYVTFLLVNKNIDLPAKISISDATGKVLLENIIQINKSEVIFDTRFLKNGTYFYQVTGQKATIQNGKISINHK
ncbi:MAG: T9SS type A sorting domain-containing protein [Bacteroidota bacterium]